MGRVGRGGQPRNSQPSHSWVRCRGKIAIILHTLARTHKVLSILKQASQCIKQGKIYALNWELEQPNPPLFGRPAIKHHIQPHTEQKVSFDDMYDGFNPQSSSQWDGLRHVCHFPTLKFYNGVNPADVANGVGDRLGIHHMARRGIAGRAVLLDFARWAEKHRPDFDPLQRHEVTVEELEQVAKEQGVTFKVGDILLVRTGWIAAYKKLGGGKYCEKFDYKNPSAAGVKACQETYAWIWNNHFAAVAGDVFAFEAFPPKSWDDSCRKWLVLRTVFVPHSIINPPIFIARFHVPRCFRYANW